MVNDDIKNIETKLNTIENICVSVLSNSLKEELLTNNLPITEVFILYGGTNFNVLGSKQYKIESLYELIICMNNPNNIDCQIDNVNTLINIWKAIDSIGSKYELINCKIVDKNSDMERWILQFVTNDVFRY